MADNFKPDSSIKKFLTEISSSHLISIVNGMCNTNFTTKATNLLDILDDSMIALKTGLPLEQVQQLRAKL